MNTRYLRDEILEQFRKRVEGQARHQLRNKVSYKVCDRVWRQVWEINLRLKPPRFGGQNFTEMVEDECKHSKGPV
jgi:hypothetical protein